MNTISSAITSAELGQTAALPLSAGSPVQTRPTARQTGSVRPAQPPLAPKLRAQTAVRRSASQRHNSGARRISRSSGVERSGSVSAHDLQSAVLLVLILYASIALLDLKAELPTLIQHWRSFVEFLASTLFAVQNPS